MKEPLKTGLAPYAPYAPYAAAQAIDGPFNVDCQEYQDLKDLLTRLAIQHLPKNGIAPSDAAPAKVGDYKFEVRSYPWDKSNLPKMFQSLREEILKNGSNFQYKRVNTSYIPSPSNGIDIEVPGAYISCVRTFGPTIPEKIYPEEAKVMMLMCFMIRPEQ